MKHLIKIIFLLAFIAPFTSVSATTHDDATMDVIEHSSSERYEHEIELPNDNDDVAHDKEHRNDDEHGQDEANDDRDNSMDDKDDSTDDKDDSRDNAVHTSHDDK